MRFWSMLFFLMFCLVGFGREPVALFYNPGQTVWLEDPVAQERLEALLAADGIRSVSAATPEDYLAAERQWQPRWIFYAPCETMPTALADTMALQLRDGARVITGAGMPFWYEIAADGTVVEREGRIGERAAGLHGGFASGTATLTALGTTLLGAETDVSGIIRGIASIAAPDLVLLPLASEGALAALGIVLYPNDGKFFYAGTAALSRGPLNILTPEGEERWRRILAFLDKPQAELQLTPFPMERVLDGQAAAQNITLQLRNPSDRPLDSAVRWYARRESGFGAPADLTVGPWQSVPLAPHGTAELSAEWPLPPPPQWGVYTIGFESVDGPLATLPLQLLPPAAVDYLDAHPLFAAPGAERRLEAGVYGFTDDMPGTLILECDDGDGQWRELASAAVTTQRGIQAVALPPQSPARDTRYRVTLRDRDGVRLHDTELLVSVASENPAFQRRSTLFRALDGLQFTLEKEVIFDDLLAMRQRWPLFRGVQPGRVTPEVRDWLRDHDFTLNYGAMLNDIQHIGAWGLNDSNAAGVSAVKLMPGHSEDPARWLVRQNSRARFAQLVQADPEIVNLIEAVPGYETPGLFSADERGGADVAHFLGYAPDGVARHWEALAGIDGGVRQLEPGGTDFRRKTMPELYQEIYNEPLPEPQQFGWQSWQEYEPLRLNQAQQHGYLNADEALRFRLHFFLRSYFHLKRIDDLSGWLHAYSGEVHNVAHEGPLIAQISALAFRLPYVDTNTIWLFRSAWRHAWGVTEGTAVFLHDYSALFQHRFGLHEEIGGGQWAAYRTAETSFVSVFTKRAAVPFADLQVDFYLGRDRSYRVKEEQAMYQGFQLAVDSAAQPAVTPRIALVGSSSSYYPELKRGVSRGEWLAPMLLDFSALLREHHLPFRSLASPLLDPALFESYDLILFNSEHPMAGDLTVLAEWLTREPGRTVVLNHAGSWDLDYTGGFAVHELRFNPARRPLAAFGIDATAPERVMVSALNGQAIGQEVAMLYLAPPANAQALLRDQAGRAIVWSAPSGAGTVIYSGVPFGNVLRGSDPEQVLFTQWARLLQNAGYEPAATTIEAPAGWFIGAYRLNQDRLAVAAINPGEAKVADSDYGDVGDGVEKAAAQLGLTPVRLIWRGAAEPASRWRLTDAWSGEATGMEFTADAAGTLDLRFEAPVAKLYILNRI